MIKCDLEILPKRLIGIEEIDDYELCDNVELYIKLYPCLNKGRIRRINAIKSILDKYNIIQESSPPSATKTFKKPYS